MEQTALYQHWMHDLLYIPIESFSPQWVTFTYHNYVERDNDKSNQIVYIYKYKY